MHKPLPSYRLRSQRRRASERRARVLFDVVAPLMLMFAPLVGLAAGAAFAFVGL